MKNMKITTHEQIKGFEGKNIVATFSNGNKSKLNLIDNSGDISSFPWKDTLGSGYYSDSFITDIILLDKTMDSLEVGDLIISGNGYYRRILGICGEVIFTSIASRSKSDRSKSDDILKVLALSCTLFELKKSGYKLVTESQPKIETIEIDGLKYDKAEAKKRLVTLEPLE